MCRAMFSLDIHPESIGPVSDSAFGSPVLGLIESLKPSSYFFFSFRRRVTFHPVPLYVHTIAEVYIKVKYFFINNC